jgi:hypothetical protein
MITALITTVVLTMNAGGDFRMRAEHRWPEPRGITENLWRGSALSFYQRLLTSFGKWSCVILTEKDPGEEWGDLIAGGISYTNPESFTAAAGALRVQMAHGLVLCHPGEWSGTDVLGLSKTPGFRLRFEPSESPGAIDADPLTGAAAEYHFSNLSFSTVLGWSKIDTGSSGLHRTESELANRRSVDEKLAAVRAAYGPVGISFAHVYRTEDSLSVSASRIGTDFLFETEEAVLTGEIATDLDTTFNFMVSGSRGTAQFSHALTLSRFTGSQYRSSGGLVSGHQMGAGYGLTWRPQQGITLDAGTLFQDREEEDSFSAGFQLTERAGSRTDLTQRLKYTSTGEERTLTGQITTAWSPNSDLTLSLKLPFTRYSCTGSPGETGTGVEIRLKHNPVNMLEFSISAAAASTNGWNSSVYAYSLSFPGEFGSQVMYNSAVLLQGSVSVHVSENATVRMKAAWYNMNGAESLGSGSDETEGPARTSAGLQVDWSFQ